MRLLPALLLLATAAWALDTDGDGDGDGLSDIAERHKYFTDPAKADSDGDGTPDGDWDERREYAYTVRTVIRVMRPAAAICDDYQDARVLDETDDYVELEVVQYPLNTVAEGIGSSRDWQHAADRPVEYLASTTTSNWDTGMRDALLAELEDAGIDPDALDDRAFVERTAALLIERSQRTADLTVYFTHFPGGEPAILPGLEAAVARHDPGGHTLEERWQRDLFARGMYARRAHGSCTSTSIYLQGCLRAVGIPTRTILCVPAVDPSDPDEVAMIARLRHPGVRRTLLGFCRPVRGSWVAHTLNEVWVGGRWRRLNYARLGQNILDTEYLGLMTHVLTVRDWADTRIAETVGRRQASGHRDDAFGHLNPYSTLRISDEFGDHAQVPVDGPRAVLRRVTIDRWIWSDAPAQGGPCLLGRVVEQGPWEEFRRFTAEADPTFFLEAEGAPPIAIRCAVGGITTGGSRYVVLMVDAALIDDGTAYRLRPRNESVSRRWVVSDGAVAPRTAGRRPPG